MVINNKFRKTGMLLIALLIVLVYYFGWGWGIGATLGIYIALYLQSEKNSTKKPLEFPPSLVEYMLEAEKQKHGVYEELFEKYKHLFNADEFYNTNPIAICISTHSCEISCPNGWYKPLEKMIRGIDQHIKTKKDNLNSIKFTSIREKWTELDVYFDGEADDKLLEIISNAEKEVKNICSICAKKTKLKTYRIVGWEYKLCDECGEGHPLSKYQDE